MKQVLNTMRAIQNQGSAGSEGNRALNTNIRSIQQIEVIQEELQEQLFRMSEELRL